MNIGDTLDKRSGGWPHRCPACAEEPATFRYNPGRNHYQCSRGHVFAISSKRGNEITQVTLQVSAH